MIEFKDVSKIFGNKQALSHVSLRIDPGEFVCITGPSGSGKSTLLHLLIRLTDPSDGKIEVDGADLRRLPFGVLQLYRQRTGILFQDYRLLSDRTVRENVALPLEATEDPDESINKRVTGMLKRLDIGQIEHSFPAELSGGEKTRTGLARALVHKPSIVLVDEPTGNIDPNQSQDILALLKKVNEEGATVILATHDKLLVDTLNVRVIRLEDGKVVRDAIGGYATQMMSERANHVSSQADGKSQEKHSSRGHVRPIGVQ